LPKAADFSDYEKARDLVNYEGYFQAMITANDHEPGNEL